MACRAKIFSEFLCHCSIDIRSEVQVKFSYIWVFCEMLINCLIFYQVSISYWIHFFNLAELEFDMHAVLWPGIKWCSDFECVESHGTDVCCRIYDLSGDCSLPDWIWDCLWLRSNSTCSCNDAHLAAVLAHNSVVEICWHMKAVVKQVSCVETCLLYP